MSNIENPGSSGEGNIEKDEVNKKEKIGQCASFEELFVVLDAIGSIKGSQQEYSVSILKELIERARKNPGYLSQITNTYGLRNKVIELIRAGL